LLRDRDLRGGGGGGGWSLASFSASLSLTWQKEEGLQLYSNFLAVSYSFISIERKKTKSQGSVIVLGNYFIFERLKLYCV
jgi:hypothetical protein